MQPPVKLGYYPISGRMVGKLTGGTLRDRGDWELRGGTLIPANGAEMWNWIKLEGGLQARMFPGVVIPGRKGTVSSSMKSLPHEAQTRSWSCLITSFIQNLRNCED